MLKNILLPTYRFFLKMKLRRIAAPRIALHKLASQLLIGGIFIASASQTLAATQPSGVAPMSIVNAGTRHITTTGYIDTRTANLEISQLASNTPVHVTDTKRTSRGFFAGHNGIDYDGEFGDGIYAMLPGTITLVSSSGPLGNHIAIEHDNGIKTVYAHLQSMQVSQGDEVRAGDVLGTMGSTGRSTGSHLHIESYVNGVAVDPMIFLANAELK